MPKKLIDLDGLAYVWTKIKTSMVQLMTGKANIYLTNVTDDDFRDKAERYCSTCYSLCYYCSF